jgi:hypothetical protein
VRTLSKLVNTYKTAFRRRVKTMSGEMNMSKEMNVSRDMNMSREMGMSLPPLKKK